MIVTDTKTSTRPRRPLAVHCPRCQFAMEYERHDGCLHILHCIWCGVDYYFPGPERSPRSANPPAATHTTTPQPETQQPPDPRRRRRPSPALMLYGSPEWLERWAGRHREIIALVDAGASLEEIAARTGMGRKRVQAVWTELQEWREAGEIPAQPATGGRG